MIALINEGTGKMIHVLENSKQKLLFGGLRNLLDNGGDLRTISYLSRELAHVECPSEGTYHLLFAQSALQSDKIIVVYGRDQWLFEGDNGRFDLILLKVSPDNTIRYFISCVGSTKKVSGGVSTSGVVGVDNLLNEIARTSGMAKVIDTDDSLIVLAVDKDYCYMPDCYDDLPYKPSRTIERFKNEIKQPTQEIEKMSNVKTNAVSVMNKNKSAATNVAKLEAGRIAIKQVSKVVTPKLPMMVRGYADTAVGRLVMANLFSFAVQQFASQNKSAVLVADAMLEGSMLEALQSLNIEQMIDEVLSKVDISKLQQSEE